MTDKQIIIDVTQCPYYKEGKICTYLPFESKCEGDCNWTAYKEMEEKLAYKDQECEELKSLLKVRIEDLCDSCGASFMKLMPYKVYEKTLTEIKELLLKTPTDSKEHCVNAKSIILQKISEVE